MVYAFEVIGIVFILAMFYFTMLQYQRKSLTKVGLWFWNIIWFIGILLVILHNQVNKLLDPLNIIRVMDLYMILAFMFLFIVIFYLTIRNRKTEDRLEKLTRIVALKPLEKENKQEKKKSRRI